MGGNWFSMALKCSIMSANFIWKFCTLFICFWKWNLQKSLLLQHHLPAFNPDKRLSLVDLALVNLWLSGTYRVTGQVSPCFCYPCLRGLPACHMQPEPVACFTPHSEAQTQRPILQHPPCSLLHGLCLVGTLSSWSGFLLPSRFLCLDLWAFEFSPHLGHWKRRFLQSVSFTIKSKTFPPPFCILSYSP